MGRCEAHALDALDAAHGAQQVGERAALTESDAVGVDVLTQQGHFDSALRGDGLDLGENVAGATVTFLAAQVRNDAERARVVTTHGDGHPCGVRALTVGRQGRGKDLEGFLDLHGGRAVMLGAAQERREHVDVMRAKDGIHPRSLLDDAVTHLLGETATNRDLHAGARALDGSELTEVTEKAGRCVLAHGAGVDDNDVGAHVTGIGRTGGSLRDLLNGDEAGLLEQTRHSFGVVFIHLAAERAHSVGAGHGGAVLRHRIHRSEV